MTDSRESKRGKPTTEELLDTCMRIVAAKAKASAVDLRDTAEAYLRGRHHASFSARLEKLGENWGQAVVQLHCVAKHFGQIGATLAKLRGQDYIDEGVARLAADVVQAACQDDDATIRGQWCPIEPPGPVPPQPRS